MDQSKKMIEQHPALTLEQLLAIIRQLDEPALRQVARILEETGSRPAPIYEIDLIEMEDPPAEDLIIEAKIDTVLQLSG